MLLKYVSSTCHPFCKEWHVDDDVSSLICPLRNDWRSLMTTVFSFCDLVLWCAMCFLLILLMGRLVIGTWQWSVASLKLDKGEWCLLLNLSSIMVTFWLASAYQSCLASIMINCRRSSSSSCKQEHFWNDGPYIRQEWKLSWVMIKKNGVIHVGHLMHNKP